jgi:hypothetical protein
MPSPTSSSVPLSRIVSDYRLYSRAFLKVVSMDKERVPFIWNKPQRRLAAAVKYQQDRQQPVRVIILKSRKVGISTWVQGFNFWSAHLHDDCDGVTLAHTIESAQELFEIQRNFYDGFAELPEGHPLHVQKRRLTRKLIQFQTTGSSTQVLTVGKGSGRGLTPFRVHGSEVAFWENAKEALLAVRNAAPRTPETAVFLESTPHGWGNVFHEEWLRAKAKRSGYIALFISWMDDPRAHAIPWFTDGDLDDDERDLVRLYGIGLDQLAWRRTTVENECGGDVDQFKQEYPSDDVSCFLTSGRPVISASSLQYQTDALPKPDPYEGLVQSEITFNAELQRVEVIPERRGRLIILRPPIPRHRYIDAWDPSEGDPGSTASPGVVLDQYDLKVSAVWYGRTPPDLLADHAVLVSRYYNDALLAWEANNTGLAFGNRVEELGYHNIFMRMVSEDSISKKPGLKPGYSTREQSRKHLFLCLAQYAREAAKQHWPPILHPVVVGEMSTLIYDGDKAMAQPGCLFDTLIALGICLYIHRGNMETALEPLSREVIERAFSEIIPNLRLGIRPTQQQLDEGNMTMEELERLDEMSYELEKSQRRRGLGRSA